MQTYYVFLHLLPGMRNYRHIQLIYNSINCKIIIIIEYYLIHLWYLKKNHEKKHKTI